MRDFRRECGSREISGLGNQRPQPTGQRLRQVAWFALIERRDVPPRVVISEYVDIARAFFDDGDEPGLANAILDAIARRVREDDLAGGRAKA